MREKYGKISLSGHYVQKFILGHFLHKFPFKHLTVELMWTRLEHQYNDELK